MYTIGKFCAALLIGATAATSHAAVLNRLMVADMSDFGTNLGFYLDFENQAPDGQTCQIDTLHTYLGVADGKAWKFLSPDIKFQTGQVIHLSAVITPTDCSITVNDVSARAATGFAPHPGPLLAASVPSWAAGAASYRIVELSLAVFVDGAANTFNFPGSHRSPALALFENPLPVQRTIGLKAGQTVRIEADIRIDPALDVRQFIPLVDEYGQATEARYPGKIHNDTQLQAAFAADDRQLAAWKPRTDVDKFGGQLHVAWAKSLRGTGFYRVVKQNGYWWLITPLGNPVFYTGVCTAPATNWDCTPVTGREELFAYLPPKTGLTASLWRRNVWGSEPDTDYAVLHAMNLVRRFGADRYDAAARTECRKRLAAWGFSGLGKWADGDSTTPTLPVISAGDVPRIDRHFDVFDPEVRKKLQDEISRQIRPNRNSPYILGYSFGNEYDECIQPSEVEHILASPTASPAKMAFIKWALTTVYRGSEAALRTAWGVASAAAFDSQPLKATPQAVETLRRYYASAYYETLYTTFKKADPNHLYFGFWIVPGWWVSDLDWNLIAPHVDVIGFDRYSDWPGIKYLLNRFDKPVLLGEFSFPSWYEGARGMGRYGCYTNSDAESGQRYAGLLAAATACPQCVGTMWFQYRDEPISGRGPVAGHSAAEGEHYAFGLVDACDLPKYDLVRTVRTANLEANSARLTATK